MNIAMQLRTKADGRDNVLAVDIRLSGLCRRLVTNGQGLLLKWVNGEIGTKV